MLLKKYSVWLYLGNGVDESLAKGNPRVFVGNLAFSASEDELWELFGSCGEVTQVRMGKYRLVLVDSPPF